MKFSFMSFALLFSLQSFTADSIDQSILDKVARDIDNICGDTYCEGDFNWNHENLRCDLSKGTCSLEVSLLDQFMTEDDYPGFEEELEARKIFEDKMLKSFSDISLDIEEDYARILVLKRNCEIEGMKEFSDVVDENSYSEKLMDGVIKCVSRMEDDYYAKSEIAGQ